MTAIFLTFNITKSDNRNNEEMEDLKKIMKFAILLAVTMVFLIWAAANVIDFVKKSGILMSPYETVWIAKVKGI